MWELRGSWHGTVSSTQYADHEKATKPSMPCFVPIPLG
jgi:hypothetical protein